MNTQKRMASESVNYFMELVNEGNKVTGRGWHRYVSTPNGELIARTCGTCQMLMPVNEFGSHHRGKGGIQTNCRQCSSDLSMDAYRNRQRKAQSELVAINGPILGGDGVRETVQEIEELREKLEYQSQWNTILESGNKFLSDKLMETIADRDSVMAQAKRYRKELNELSAKADKLQKENDVLNTTMENMVGLDDTGEQLLLSHDPTEGMEIGAAIVQFDDLVESLGGVDLTTVDTATRAELDLLVEVIVGHAMSLSLDELESVLEYNYRQLEQGNGLGHHVQVYQRLMDAWMEYKQG